MRRIIFSTILVGALSGLDIVANSATITRDVLAVFVNAGKTATRAVDATVEFMVGGARAG